MGGWGWCCECIVKVKGPLTIRSSCGRLWGCGAHLALLAEGAGVQLPGHVASMTKPLLVNQSSARKRRLPSRQSGTYLSTCALMCFQTARLAEAGNRRPSDRQALGHLRPVVNLSLFIVIPTIRDWYLLSIYNTGRETVL